LGSKRDKESNEFTPQERLDGKNQSFENPRQPRDKDKMQPTQNPSIRDEEDIEIAPKKYISTNDIKK